MAYVDNLITDHEADSLPAKNYTHYFKPQIRNVPN